MNHLMIRPKKDYIHIIPTLQTYTEWLEKERHLDVFFTVLYGSQNYNMATPYSDIDAYAVILPSMDSLLFEKPYRHTVTYPYEKYVYDCTQGAIKIQDIREFTEHLLKLHYSALETLFTPYVYVNPKYQAYYEEYMKATESVATLCKEYTALQAFRNASTLNAKIVRWMNFPNANQDYSNIGASKDLARIYHLLYFADAILDEESPHIALDLYANTNPTVYDEIMALKLQPIEDMTAFQIAHQNMRPFYCEVESRVKQAIDAYSKNKRMKIYRETPQYLETETKIHDFIKTIITDTVIKPIS